MMRDGIIAAHNERYLATETTPEEKAVQALIPENTVEHPNAMQEAIDNLTVEQRALWDNAARKGAARNASFTQMGREYHILLGYSWAK